MFCQRLSLGFLLGGVLLVPSLRVMRADTGTSYPFQSAQNFRTEGVVTVVDPDRERVEITTSSGRHYNLDTDSARIALPGMAQPASTDDLVVGMHIRVVGTALSSDVVAASSVTVLPLSATNSAAQVPARPRTVSDVVGSTGAQSIRLRGTVESVDDRNGIVVVRVRDHTRTVKVDSHTDLTDIQAPDDNTIGVRPGDRLTVNGILRPDGTVVANAVSLNRDLAARVPVPAATPDDTYDARELVGRVSHESDKFTTRDIKVRLESDRQVTVHVPHDARVLRDGHPISVHNLTTDDVIRVQGYYDGDDFNASRIDVLQAYMDEE